MQTGVSFGGIGGFNVNGTANVGGIGLSPCGGCPEVSVGSGGLLNVSSFGGGGLGTFVAGTMNIASSNITLGGVDSDGIGINGGTVTVGTGNLLPLDSPNTLVNAGAIVTGGIVSAGITVGGGVQGPPFYGLQVLPNGTLEEVIGGPATFGTLNTFVPPSGPGQLPLFLPVSLAGTLAITLADSYIPSVGQTFTIINTGGGAAISGMFSNIEGQTFNSGTEMWDVDYVSQFGTVSEVELVAVATPEPSLLVLAGLGLLGIVWAHRREPARAS